MSKADANALLLKHDAEITQLKISTSHMLFLWKAVGAVALVAMGAWLTSLFGAI